METHRISCQLSAQCIDQISELTDELLTEAKTSRKNILRLRLSVEEVLLKWLDAFGEDTQCTFSAGKRLGRRYISLSVVGDRVNPFEIEDEIIDIVSGETNQNILANLGLAPSYSYINGENRITLIPKKEKRNPVFSLSIAVCLAILLGLAAQMLPQSTRVAVAEGVLSPIFHTFIGLLAALAGPMILLSVMWGIYNIGDTRTPGMIGKKMIGRFAFLTFFAMLFILSLVIWLFPVSFTGTGTGSGGLSELYLMILGIIPSNLVAPFVEGNSMQIIFIAVIFGLAMLVLGDKATAVAHFVEQLNFVVQLIMEFLSSMIPIFIFVSILEMILSDIISVMSSVIKPLVLVSLGSLIFLATMMAVLSFFQQVPFSVLVKKLLPVFMIGITTASSAATFATNMETCEKKLGIYPKIVGFGLPLGAVLFMPATAIGFLIIAISMAESFDIAVTPPWLLIAMLLSGILAMAAPPVPGGALSCYTILFSQLGIPLEAIAFAIAIDVVYDFVATSVNITSLPVVLTMLPES